MTWSTVKMEIFTFISVLFCPFIVAQLDRKIFSKELKTLSALGQWWIVGGNAADLMIYYSMWGIWIQTLLPRLPGEIFKMTPFPFPQII